MIGITREEMIQNDEIFLISIFKQKNLTLIDDRFMK